MKTQKRYWIQERAPDGGFFDSLGLSTCNEEDAIAQLKSWREKFPDGKFRLILRTDEVVQ